jgi:hypothetical protein
MPKIRVGDIVKVVNADKFGYSSTKNGSEGIVTCVYDGGSYFKANWYKLTGSFRFVSEASSWQINTDAVEIIKSRSNKELICEKIIEMRNKRKALGYKY